MTDCETTRETDGEVPYDQDFLQWVVDLSHATLRDAEHTLAYPSALIGVLVFVLGTQMDAFLPGDACPYWLRVLVWLVLAEGLLALAGGIWSLVRALHGDLVNEIKQRGTAEGQFVSDEATRHGADAERCRQLALYRTLLDLSAEQAVENRGAAYVRAMAAVLLFMVARVALAMAGC